MIVSKTFTFDAAHHLPNYDGPCKRVHGHTFKVELVFDGEKNPKTGMVVDFKLIKDIWVKDIEPKLDHRDLNEILDNPTAENIAQWIFTRIVSFVTKFWNYDVDLISVAVWESPTSCARYRISDWVEDFPEEAEKYFAVESE
jgi:6-pyruvoyltetrahydropterin/6-carboxytetrahydropterin synthase